MGRIKGMNSVRKELRQLKKKARVATDRGAMKVAQVIRDEARANAPVDMGRIKQSREVEKRVDYTVVFADPNVAPHAPYLEFGTGDFAVAPAPEYVEYMGEFIVNRK